MKKMTTLFKVTYHEKGTPGIISEEVREENNWVFTDSYNVKATVKFDGTACAIIDKVLYKRYDAKKGKKPPEGAIPCQEPDIITGHWPHWVKVDFTLAENKHFNDVIDAIKDLDDGTYEFCGPKIGNNPEKLDKHCLLRHGELVVQIPFTFEAIKEYLSDVNNNVEGLVFHHKDGRMCKIRKSDFGFKR